MIKIIIGNQPTPDSILRQRDKALVTTDSTEDALKSLVRLLQNNSQLLSDPQMLNHLSTSDLATPLDLKCLVKYLSDKKVGLAVADIIQEIGDEENSSLAILVINENANGTIKPGVIYHVNPMDLDMLKIYQDTKDRYNVLPESIYSDAPFNDELASAKDVKQITGSAYNNQLVSLQSMFKELGFKTFIIA